MLIPAALFGVLGFVATGFVSGTPEFRRPSRAPSGFSSPVELAQQHYASLQADLAQIPEACLNGATANDFQKHQCDEYWSALIKRVALGILPVFSILFFYLPVRGIFEKVYTRSRKAIEKGKAFSSATAVPFAGAGKASDFFCWFFCFSKQSVQLPNRSMVDVYFPQAAILPRPGQTVAVFELGRVFGRARYIGVLHTPHVAVVSGV